MSGIFSNAQIIGGRVLIMAVILVIGAIAYKSGVVTRDGTKQLSAVELKIVNPLLIFMSYQSDNSKGLHGLLWTFALSAAAFAVMIPLARLLRRGGDKDSIIERFSCIYSNCGFMGIPLISALYGSEGVLYLTGFITVFNLLVFTHGYMLMKEQRDLSALRQAVTSPTIIAVVVGAVCYLLRLRLGEIPAVGGVLTGAFQFIADMNTPLAMLIAGATAAQSGVLRSFTDKGVMFTTFVKLLLMPTVVALLLHLLPQSVPEMSKLIVCVACACPAATTGTMFALLFDKNAERCSEIFAVTTVLSIVTLPIMTAVATILL